MLKIKTYADLIEWTRNLHASLAQCLAHCASRHSDERAALMMDYMAAHETKMEKMLAAYQRQADPKAASTRLYEYAPPKSITTLLNCNDYYSSLDEQKISAEVFKFHEEIIGVYRTLVGKAEIEEAVELMQSILDMEEQETKRLARQVARADDM